MKKQGQEVHIAFCSHENSIPEFENQIKAAGIIIHNFKVSRYSFSNISHISSLQKEHQFDIIHAHLFPTQYWLGIAKKRMKKVPVFVKTEHNTHNNRRSIIFMKPIDKWVYRQYDKIIAITQQVKTNLDTWTNMPEKSIIINNGVSIKDVQEAITEEVETYNFLKKENKNILMVGRFAGGGKDQTTLIESMQYLPENYHLYFAGTGDLMQNAEDKTHELKLQKRVHFLGMRTDVYYLMNLVDINILSSNFEGLSGVTLESLASCRPFIGSNVPGIQEIVPNSDFLFPKKNPTALAQKIESIVENPNTQQKMVSIANQHVQQFDIQVMAEKYVNLYKDLLNQRN